MLIEVLYNFGVSLVTWTTLVPWLLLKGLVDRSRWLELGQRLGRPGTASETGPGCVLVHAVSVGEVKVAGTVIQHLRRFRPQLEVVLSVGNREGWQTAKEIEQVERGIRKVVYLPWDRYRNLRRWLSSFEPSLVVVIETELWPGLFLACLDLEIPLCVVNGRIYPRDLGRYRLIRPFFQRVLSCADWIGVLSQQEKERFHQIGASPDRLEVVGNCKFDQIASFPDSGFPWQERVPPGATVLVAASTHSPEEKWILESFRQLQPSFSDLRLVIAPRARSRFNAIARLIRRHGFGVARASAPDEISPGWEVLLLDGYGWLSAAYKRADIVIMGGSFVPRGGHNLLEAAAKGTAIIVGPHVEHFQAEVSHFSEKEALIQLKGREQLVSELHRLLSNPGLRRDLGRSARRTLQGGAGASSQYARSLLRRLEGPTREEH